MFRTLSRLGIQRKRRDDSELDSGSISRERSRTRSSGEPATQLGPGIGPEQLAGVGSAIWTETISDFDDLTFLVLPRLAGNAHKAWSEPRAGEWDEHRAAVAAHGRMWDRDGLTSFRSSFIPWV